MLQANAIVLNTTIAQRVVLFLGFRESRLLGDRVDWNIKLIGNLGSRDTRSREAKSAMASGQAAAKRSDPAPGRQIEPSIILKKREKEKKKKVQ